MEQFFYTIKFNDRVIASKVDFEFAIIFAESIFNKYFADPNISVTIEREHKDFSVFEEA